MVKLVGLSHFDVLGTVYITKILQANFSVRILKNIIKYLILGDEMILLVYRLSPVSH